MKASTETSQKASLHDTYAPLYLFQCIFIFVLMSYPQAELGLNEHHQNEVISYMRFARFKRGLRLKTVDSCFQDLKDSRYQGWGGAVLSKNKAKYASNNCRFNCFMG